jgi:hypothetical protein
MAKPKGSGKFAAQGLSQVRRDWSVMRAVRRHRGSAAGPSWEEYLRNTNRGRTRYSGTK